MKTNKLPTLQAKILKELWWNQGQWTSYDKTVQRAVQSLGKRGLVIHGWGLARATQKGIDAFDAHASRHLAPRATITTKK